MRKVGQYIQPFHAVQSTSVTEKWMDGLIDTYRACVQRWWRWWRCAAKIPAGNNSLPCAKLQYTVDVVSSVAMQTVGLYIHAGKTPVPHGDGKGQLSFFLCLCHRSTFHCIRFMEHVSIRRYVIYIDKESFNVIHCHWHYVEFYGDKARPRPTWISSVVRPTGKLQVPLL